MPASLNDGSRRPPLQDADWEVLPPEEKKKRAALDPLFKWLATIMDGLVRLPGTKFRFGLNPVVDFIPVVGDVSAAFLSASVLVYAVTRGLPKVLVLRMALNVAINELVGVVPVVGSVFALWFRANKRNYDLLQRHVAQPSRSRKGDWLFVIAVIVLVFGIIATGLIATILMLRAFADFLLKH